MILVTGAAGQLGQELKLILPPETSVFATRNELNITNKEQALEFCQKNHIDTIINAAAYTAVDQAEDDKEQAFLINAEATKNLAEVINSRGGKLIHISTDYVFSGTANTPYKESDTTSPASVYGESKLQGEKNILAIADTAIIIRTSWLYSSFGNNFVKTMLRLFNERDQLSIVDDQIGRPTYAADLASAICHALPQIKNGQKEVFHYSNSGQCSWYEFAIKIAEFSKSSIQLAPIKSEGYPTKAVRPQYSVFDNTKGLEVFNWQQPAWEESLKTCLKFLLER